MHLLPPHAATDPSSDYVRLMGTRVIKTRRACAEDASHLRVNKQSGDGGCTCIKHAVAAAAVRIIHRPEDMVRLYLVVIAAAVAEEDIRQNGNIVKGPR